MSSASKPVVLNVSEWQTSKIKYMPPKVNERGGKSINIISAQTNRALAITTPMMMTWGISDFIGDNGESDGKFSISLNFPNDEYRKPATDAFLQKFKDFENQILDDAVRNSELWWGEEMSREVCKHTSFPCLKYSKNKDTKKVDPSKPPSIRAKVPIYNGKWGTEIYDTKDKLIFPSENSNLTPMDFVPKLSNVACVLQCGGIWIGGKGWGVTWKMVQCIVKPREVVSIYGRCHIQLSEDDRGMIEGQQINDDVVDDEDNYQPVKSKPASVHMSVVPVSVPAPVSVFDTSAVDSDEEEDEEESESVSTQAAAPVQVAAVTATTTTTATTAAPVVKKIVKKAAVAEPAAEVAVAVETAPAPAAAKKIIKQ